MEVEGYGCLGTVVFTGLHKTDLKKGLRVLVQLDLAVGKNTGTIGGQAYCPLLPAQTGVLVSPTKVKKWMPGLLAGMGREDSDA